jgi:putative SbcD/Mre11-related phosphoesterase
MAVEPVPGEPAAVADCAGERALVLADYHVGLEVALRREGVEIRPAVDERRAAVLDLLDRTDADGLVILGDLTNRIGEPAGDERDELDALLEAATDRCPVTVTKGNHDGMLGETVASLGYDDEVTVVDGPGTRLGGVGFAHGHTWPARTVVEADVVCVAHEHPQVRLEDEVGGARTERVWLRSQVDAEPFAVHFDDEIHADGELVVFPAFNERLGGTWINTADEFLSPFLPAGLADGEAYLLDGTRLGDYRSL